MTQDISGQTPKRLIAMSISSYLATGNRWMLLAILRSDHPLTTEDRHLIADFIEGKIKLPRGGAPLKHLGTMAHNMTLPMRAAGFEVERLKAEWRAAGRRSKLHDEAIELASKKYGPQGENEQSEFQQKLAVFMRRPKKIRHAW